MKNPFKKLTKTGAAVPPRTTEVIQQEYVNTCAQYGAKQYQVLVFKEEMNELYRKIKSLNQEAYAVQVAAAKTAPVTPVVADTQPTEATAQ